MANPNTPVFPGQVATDNDLFVVKDNSFSNLTADISNSVTTIPVAAAAAYTLPCIIAIDNEAIKALGPASGNNITNCTRGFKGTTAASHSSGAVVFSYIFDYNINQLAVEVKAIQTALGAAMVNIIASGHAAAGDLAGTYPNPTVATVGGVTASAIATAIGNAHTQNTDTGTNSTTFQIGSAGPKIKNSSGVIQARNAADSAYVDFVCANLIVQGTTTTVHSTNVNIADNIITLNSDVVGTPTLNAGFVVNRGSSTNVDFIWNESSSKFQCGLVGSEVDILISGYTAGGDLAGTYPNPTLHTLAGMTAATFGDGTHVAQITTDTKGRITAVSSVTITGAAPSGSAGGDLTGTFPNPTVATVGGKTASVIASTVVTVTAATDVNTASTIVARDINGDFSARNITATSFIGPASSAPPTGTAAGDLAGTYPNPTLKALAGMTVASFGSGTAIPVITTDTKGRITAITTVGVTVPTHIVGQGSAPTNTPGTGAGTTPTVTNTGTDTAGQISVLTGSAPSTASVILTLTFASAYASAPFVVFSPANAAAAALATGAQPFVANVGTGSFDLKAGGTALTNAVTYLWNYHVIQ